MKSLKSFIIIIAGAAIAMIVSSCASELDPKSLGSNSTTSADVYKTTADYKSGLAKLYSSFALSGQQGPSGNPDISGLDEGFGVYLRGYWNLQELPTDEAVIAWNDQTVKNFHGLSWTPTDVFIAAMYSRVMVSVTFCNEFIRASSASTDPDVMKFHAEARYLRALAYYHALDFFGNPPFVTEADTPGAFNPKQTNSVDLFAYIDSELQAIENDLGAPKFEYARADKGALWMLQAKLYLNAEVYTGTKKYTECIAALNKLFASGAYSLGEYRQNFTADNNKSSELIFPITYDGKYTQSYGGMDYILHAALGGSMKPADYGLSNAWGGTRVTSGLVDKFTDANDTRALFYTDGQKKEIDDIGTFTDGYAVKKFTNVNFDGTPAVDGGTDYVDIDYPMFRLADGYLMYAEAGLRGGAGQSSDPLALINQLRTRAKAATITSGELTLDFVLDERARELFWEGHRRTDLIRYGYLASSTYLWPWKGNVKDGVGTDSYRNLYPIPSTDLSANPTLKQNPGYIE